MKICETNNRRVNSRHNIQFIVSVIIENSLFLFGWKGKTYLFINHIPCTINKFKLPGKFNTKDLKNSSTDGRFLNINVFKSYGYTVLFCIILNDMYLDL